MRSKKWKAAIAALALSVALLAQPLTASAWMLDAEQQQLVDNLTTGRRLCCWATTHRRSTI